MRAVPRSSRSPLSSPVRRAPWLGAALVLAACGGAAAEPQAPTASAPATASDGAGAASDHVTDAGFELSIRSGEVAVGSDATAEVELLSKQPFKCNDKYPYKFTTTASDGLELSAPVITRDQATIEHDRVVMKIPFKASQAGAHTLSGRFAFSICTADQCRIEKRDLSLQIQAK
ncbi:MAG: hypothetical protein R3B07_36845 [Polyangiaceae bacterium]